MTHDVFLSIKKLRKSFGKVEVLHGVDLDLVPGTVTALLGENGAGKSTLVRTIAGDYQPDDGHIEIDGVPVPLTRTEFDFLQLLMTKPKHVHTREQVIEAIGGSALYSSDSLLDTHASRLRAKIKSADGPRAIHAVRGVGYRLFE